MPQSIRDPRLIVAWPNSGGAALIAGHFLVNALEADAVAELTPDAPSAPRGARVKDGLLIAEGEPHNLFFEWRSALPEPGDLLEPLLLNHLGDGGRKHRLDVPGDRSGCRTPILVP